MQPRTAAAALKIAVASRTGEDNTAQRVGVDRLPRAEAERQLARSLRPQVPVEKEGACVGKHGHKLWPRGQELSLLERFKRHLPRHLAAKLLPPRVAPTPRTTALNACARLRSSDGHRLILQTE